MTKLCKCYNCEEKKECYSIKIKQDFFPFHHFYCLDCGVNLGLIELPLENIKK